MNPIEIKILMIRAGITQADIGRKLGLSRAFINQVVLGHRPTKQVKQAIAEAVGKPVEDLWPEESPNKAA